MRAALGALHPLAVCGHPIARASLHEVLPIAATDVVQRARPGVADLVVASPAEEEVGARSAHDQVAAAVALDAVVAEKGSSRNFPSGVSLNTSLRPRCIPVGGGPVQGRVRWEEDLPPGYRMREDPDLLVVLRPDGSEVAAFSALGADPLEVIAAAWEDYE